MLNFARALFGKKSPRPALGGNQSVLPPNVVAVEGLPDLQVDRHLHHHEGFPLLKWTEVESWLCPP